MADAITQNTPGLSEGYPVGIPPSYSWYSGTDTTSGNAPPANFTAVTVRGQIVTVDPPPAGYNDHFWPSARGTYALGAVDGVYVQMDMRTNDANEKLVANIGADWWLNATAGYVSNNPGVGMSNSVQLTGKWRALYFYSLSSAQLAADPLPPLEAGSLSTGPSQKG
jgi:hypothetical protein